MAIDLLRQYLDVEEVFQSDGAATEQEIIDALRKACHITLLILPCKCRCPALLIPPAPPYHRMPALLCHE